MSKKKKKKHSHAPKKASAAVNAKSRKKQQQKQKAAPKAPETQKKTPLTYEEKLHQEHLELIRLKQGIIKESDTIFEEAKEEKKYTIWQKIRNFLYHNKWWMGIAGFFVFVAGYLIYQTVTMEKPDMIILLVAHDDYFHAASSENICKLFEQYIDDENGDGKVNVDVYYIPASQQTAERSGYTGDSTKLFAEFQTGEAVLVISDEEADAFIVPDSTLMDLEDSLGMYAQTEGVRFRLADTEFANAVGWTDEPLDKDFYIGIRKVRKTMDSEEMMQKVFDISFPALQKFAADFGTPENAE